jgi:hypothetical protein
MKLAKSAGLADAGVAVTLCWPEQALADVAPPARPYDQLGAATESRSVIEVDVDTAGKLGLDPATGD